MTPEEMNKIAGELPRGRSFAIWHGAWHHTCWRGIFTEDHPAFTDEEHCGRCWKDAQVVTDEGLSAQRVLPSGE